MPEDGHDRGPGEPSSSVAARHSFTPRQTAKLKRTMQPVLASILHPLRTLGDADIDMLQTQTLASLSAQLQDDRGVDRGYRVPGDVLVAESAVDGIRASFTAVGPLSLDPGRHSLSGRLPPLPSIFPPTGLRFSDVAASRDAPPIKEILESALNQPGIPHVIPPQNPALAWRRAEMRDASTQADLVAGVGAGVATANAAVGNASRVGTTQSSGLGVGVSAPIAVPGSPVGAQSDGGASSERPPGSPSSFTLPPRSPTGQGSWGATTDRDRMPSPNARGRERKLSEFVRTRSSAREGDGEGRPATAEALSSSRTGPPTRSSRLRPSTEAGPAPTSPRHTTRPSTVPAEVAAVSDRLTPTRNRMGATVSGPLAERAIAEEGGEGLTAGVGVAAHVGLPAAVAWGADSEMGDNNSGNAGADAGVGVGAARGRRATLASRGGDGAGAADEILMAQEAFEFKYADMQEELVGARRRIEALEAELDVVTKLHNAMLEEQARTAQDMGLGKVDLGDPMLMLRAKEMYETRIASLRESEEGLGKDNRRLKEQRKDLQDEVSRLTKRLNTEVFARDQAIKRLEHVRETLKGQIETLKAQIEELTGYLKQRDEERVDMKRQLDKKDKDLLTSEMERRALKDALEKQRNATEHAEQEVLQLNGKMQEAINEWKSKLDEQMRNFEADMQEFTHMKETYAELQTERRAVQDLFEAETKSTAELRHHERVHLMRIHDLEEQVRVRDDEITRLKALVASLERRVQEDGVIIDGLKAVAREKERLERALAEEKETSAKRYQALVAEARKFEVECTRLARMLEDERHEATLARADMEDARSTADRLAAEADLLKGMLKATKDELAQAQAKASRFESLCAEARGDVHAAQRQMGKLIEENEELKETNKSLVHRVEALTQELEELREMHYKIKGQYADMEAEFEKFREQSRRELEELQGERRDHVGHVEALKAKVRQLAPLPEQLRETKEELESVRKALEKLRAQHAALSTEKIDVDRKLREVQQERDVFEGEVRGLQRDKQNLEDRLAEAQAQIADLQSDVQELEGQANALQDRFDELQRQHDALTAAHARLGADHEELLREHAMLQRVHQRHVEESDERIRVLTSERDEAREERDYLRSVDGPKNKLIEGLKERLAKPLEIPEVKALVDHIRQKLEEETKARLFREKYASTLQAKVKELEERIRQLTAPGVRQPRHRAVQVTPTDLWDDEMAAAARDASAAAEVVLPTLQSRATSPLRFSRPSTQQRTRTPSPSPSPPPPPPGPFPGADWVFDVLIEAGADAEGAARQAAMVGTPIGAGGRAVSPAGVRSPSRSPPRTPGSPGRGGSRGAAGEARVMTPQAVMDVIYEVYKEKVKADMANARWGGAPHSLKAFTSQLFHLRYSVRSVALRQLRDLGHNVRRYRHLLPVAKFGLSCGLLGEEEVSGELRTVTEFPRVGVSTDAALASTAAFPSTAHSAAQSTAHSTFELSATGVSPDAGAPPETGPLSASGALPSLRDSFAESRSAAVSRSGSRVVGVQGGVRPEDAGAAAAGAVVAGVVGRPGTAEPRPPSALSPTPRNASPLPSAAPAIPGAAIAPGNAPQAHVRRQFIDPYSGLPLPVQWRGIMTGIGLSETPPGTANALAGGAAGRAGADAGLSHAVVAHATASAAGVTGGDSGGDGAGAAGDAVDGFTSFWQPRLQPRAPPRVESLVHPATLKATRHLMSLPNAGNMLEYLASPDFFAQHVPKLDLGVPVTGRQVPQLYRMLHDVALIFHLNPARLPQVYVRPMRSADVYYLCLPMSMSRATKKMPPGLKTGLPKGDAHGAGRDRSPDHPQRQASPPRAPALAVGGASGDAAALEGPPAGPHGYGPLAPPKAGGNLNKIRTEDVVVVPDLDPEVADLKVTGRGAGDALFGRAPGENFHHCLVISSGLLDLLEPGEVRAALAGALVPFLAHRQLHQAEDGGRKKSAEASAHARDAVVIKWLPQVATAASLAELSPRVLSDQVNDGITGDTYGAVVGPAIDVWRRAHGLSEDRGALAAAQSVPVVVSAMLKAATESSVLSNELNPAALMELADQTDAQRVEDKWDKEPFMPLTAVGHSMAVLRARELRRWAGGAEFREMFRDVKAKVFFLSEEGW